MYILKNIAIATKIAEAAINIISNLLDNSFIFNSTWSKFTISSASIILFTFNIFTCKTIPSPTRIMISVIKIISTIFSGAFFSNITYPFYLTNFFISS